MGEVKKRHSEKHVFCQLRLFIPLVFGGYVPLKSATDPTDDKGLVVTEQPVTIRETTTSHPTCAGQ